MPQSKEKATVKTSENTTFFNTYFSKIYQERWPHLSQAIGQSEIQVARINGFCSESGSNSTNFEMGLKGCMPAVGSTAIARSSNGLLKSYIMDPGSIIAARALQVQNGDLVLDMCAAPGGKSLILIEALIQGGGAYLNELSAPRRERLKKVIQQYVPRDIRDRVWITGKDAIKFGLSHGETFDRILLDAPCSGERHMNVNDKIRWKLSSSQRLAAKQYGLLCSALLALKPQGRLVYSTCSLSPFENDGVIEKYLKKKTDAKVVSFDFKFEGQNFAQATQFGHIFLPDTCGFGPIYFAVIEKLE